jgi:hypothetical protein
MTGYVCSCCGKSHSEDPNCFLFEMPLYALDVPMAERAKRVDATSDQCVVDGEHFFILGNLDVAVKESDLYVRWTTWTTLSRANFLRACDLWETVGRESEPPYFGWLSNPIPGYPKTLSIKTLVHTQAVGVRPWIEVIEEGHPLWTEQREGISDQRYHELIAAANGDAQG